MQCQVAGALFGGAPPALTAPSLSAVVVSELRSVRVQGDITVPEMAASRDSSISRVARLHQGQEFWPLPTSPAGRLTPLGPLALCALWQSPASSGGPSAPPFVRAKGKREPSFQSICSSRYSPSPEGLPVLFEPLTRTCESRAQTDHRRVSSNHRLPLGSVNWQREGEFVLRNRAARLRKRP